MDAKLPILRLTNAAVARIGSLMADQSEGVVGLRVGVRDGGCSGMTYTMDFATEQAPGDEVIQLDGIKVLVDPLAIMYLIGSEMDFVTRDLGSHFIFNNPNETARCGCGESFSV